MNDYGLAHPLTMLALAYIAKDVMPWVGVQLIACGKWAAPQVEKIADALIAKLSQSKPLTAKPDTTPNPAEPQKEIAVSKG